MAKIGTLIDGKYEVLREIGRGGMSVVYLAMDTRLNKQWAVKEIARKANDANNEVVVSSLLAEANLMKKLDHPALPRIVDIIEEQNTIYVVMDYIEGEPLSKILDVDGAQDQDTVIEWGKQLCDVLFYLHNCEPPIIYRDMKPSNVMLKPDGSVKLIDFGIAREYKRSKTADTESLGTRGYAAPEQFGGKGQTDARTDIYSFGVTLYHLVTGKNPCEPPYELYPIKQINPNFYDGLQYLIQKCIQLNPEDRFQSCDEIRYVLDNIHEFDKGRRLSQNKKYKGFIATTAVAVAFALLGAGSIGIGRHQLQQSYDQNIEIIESEASDPNRVKEAFVNIQSQSGLSDMDILRAYAEYYETLYSMYGEKKDIIDTYSFSVPTDVLTDLLTSDEDGENPYANLTSEERTYLAKMYYNLGNLYFSQVDTSTKRANSLSEAKTYYTYLISEDMLNLKSDEVEYDRSENGFTESNLKWAEGLYYVSSSYLYYTSEANNSNSGVPTTEKSANKVDNSKTAFTNLIESIDMVYNDDSIDDALKINLIRAYYLPLSTSDQVRALKNNINNEDVNKLYYAIYSQNYEDVYSDAVAQFGAENIDSLSDSDIAKIKLDSSVTGGVYSIPETSADLNDIRSDRFSIAKMIHDAYNN